MPNKHTNFNKNANFYNKKSKIEKSKFWDSNRKWNVNNTIILVDGLNMNKLLKDFEKHDHSSR